MALHVPTPSAGPRRRRIASRTCPVLICALAGLGGLVGGPATAAADAGFDPTVTVTYAGTIANVEQNPSELGGPFDGYASLSYTVNWTETGTAPVDDLNALSATSGPYRDISEEASGTISFQPSSLLSTSIPACSASISATNLPGAPSGLGGGGISPSTILVIAPGAASAAGELTGGVPVQSTAHTPTRDPCDIDAGLPQPSLGATTLMTDPNLAAFASPKLESTARSDSHTWTFADSGSDGQGGTDMVSGTETLSYAITTGPPPPPPTNAPPQTTKLTFGPGFAQATKAAHTDLLDRALPDAANLCLTAQTSAALQRDHVLRLPTGAATASLASVGPLTAATLGPLCAASISRFTDDYDTYLQGPLTSITLVVQPSGGSDVHLPSCRPYKIVSMLTRFAVCTRLRADDELLAGAAGDVATLQSGIETIVRAERIAYLEGDQAAVDAQDTHLRSLLARERSAVAGEDHAGARVASLLAAAHIRLFLDRERSDAADGLVERQLAQQGVSLGDVLSLDALALRPAPAHLLTRLREL